jgi:hypothetical protein
MTEEEYFRLRDVTERHGARSVSEFARTTLLTGFPPDAAPGGNWRQPFDALATRVAKAEHEIADIKDILYLKTLTQDPTSTS